MTDGNRNENGNELLTVSEAAQRLGVTIPRLRRLLSRPEFAALAQTVERGTRTGTRAAQVVPVSILVLLSDALESGSQSQNEQEREQTQTGTGTGTNENAGAQAAAPDAGPLVEHLRGEVEFLRAEIERRDVAESELRRLMLTDRAELSELRQRIAILPAPPASDTDTGANGSDGKSQGEAKQDAGNGVEKKTRRWWEWRRR